MHIYIQASDHIIFTTSWTGNADRVGKSGFYRESESPVFIETVKVKPSMQNQEKHKETRFLVETNIEDSIC